MNKKHIVSSIILIVLISVLTYKKSERFDVFAKVEISNKEYDFGRISHLDTVKHTFTIKNIGKESLLITKVIANCTCTVTSYDSGIILPDSIARIKAMFIPDKNRLGKNSASILVEGNFKDGVKRLDLKGYVTD